MATPPDDTTTLAADRATPDLARSAGLIAALTAVSRVVGFGRIFVFSWAVGITTLGGIYQTINTLPNIIFEIVAGGALAAVVVPLVSTALTRGAVADINQLASSLLTWAVLVLTPLAALVAIFAHDIARAMLGTHASGAEVDVGARMLIVFAPQLVLYGIGIVLTGVVQAFHRFAWPALAPMLSSLTVMAAYLGFAFTAGRCKSPSAQAWCEDIAVLSTRDEAILAGGTTLAVVVLTVTLFIPLRATGVKIRPSFTFPEGTSAKVRALVASGVATVGAQQIALLVVLLLLQPPAPEGAVLDFNLAQTIYFLPWAVLAVPIATSAFPRLSAAWSANNRELFVSTLQNSSRAVIVLCVGASAAMIATAQPMAEIITAVAAGRESTDEIAYAIVAFAPGLVGYSLLALLSRALYATGASLSTAVVTASGWALVIAADVILAAITPAEDRVVVVALGNSFGMVALGIGLSWLVRQRAHNPLHVGKVTVLAAGSGIISAAVGLGLLRFLPSGSTLGEVSSGIVVALVTLGCYVGLIMLVDKSAARAIVARFMRGKSANT